MTRLFERQIFEGLFDRDSGGLFADLEFRRCTFIGCGLSITGNPALRSVVRGVRLLRCEQRGCGIETAIFEECVVENLKTNGVLQTWGAAFRRVTLRGPIGRLMLSADLGAGLGLPAVRSAFAAANAEYYRGVDWALDISAAEFEECDIRGIPVDLIKRDRDTQVIVRRSDVLGGSWREIDLSGTFWRVAIELFLERGDPDLLLVAPKRNRQFRELLRGLQRLRDGGIAQ